MTSIASRPEMDRHLIPAGTGRLSLRLSLLFLATVIALVFGSATAAWALTPTAVTIRTDKTKAGYLAKYSPNMTGMVSPSPATIGKLMHVNVKKPGKGYWTYSSNRIVYNSRGQAMWQYRYIFKTGMPKGVYYYQAFFNKSATYALSSSGIIAIGLNVTPPAPSDRTAPTTSSDAVASYTGSAVINLTATDSGSGVAQTYYKLDGGAQSEGRQVAVNAEGAHTLQFWSVDKLTHKEAAKTVSFTVTGGGGGDTQAPTTSSNVAASYVGNASITLTGLDNTGGSGVAHTYYTLDGAAQIEGTSISVSAVGPHTIQFWSVDVAGNVETPKSASFTINPPQGGDTTPPTTTSDAKSNYTGPAVITFTANDNPGGSGVAATYHKVDGGQQIAGLTANVAGLGSHTVDFWSVDNAGNAETPHSVTITLSSGDTTPPSTVSDAQSGYIGNAVIQLVASDNTGGTGVAHTYYKLDGGSQTEGTTINVGGIGSHTLQYWSVDFAGNAESPVTKDFAISQGTDTSAPNTRIDSSSFFFGPASIVLSPTDTGGSGLAHTYYKLDGGSQTEGKTINVSAAGSHNLEAWSTDNAGNVETPPKTATFQVVPMSEVQQFDIQANSGPTGFSPDPLFVPAGKPIQITFSAQDTGGGCFAIITFDAGPSAAISRGPASVQFLSLSPGFWGYHCNMNMFSGTVIAQ